MCYPETCSRCRKTTWGGCGQHVDSVMKSVAATDRCTCTENFSRPAKSRFFASIFGR